MMEFIVQLVVKKKQKPTCMKSQKKEKGMWARYKVSVCPSSVLPDW